jgi:hypothetical protein
MTQFRDKDIQNVTRIVAFAGAIYLTGKTAIGRTTLRVLNMNSEDQLALCSS